MRLFGTHIQAAIRPVIWLLLWQASSGFANQVRVEVEGDYDQLQENAEILLGEVEDRTADGLRRYASSAAAQVEEAVRALGYYNPTIHWQVNEQDEAPAELVLTIVPGEPVRVRSRQVDIQGPGADDPDLVQRLPERPREGDILNHGEYDGLRQAIQNRAGRLGYFDGEYETRKLKVDPDDNAADILLTYRTGERYQLGEVTFLEGHGFDEQLLRQFVTTEPGEPFHADKVARLNRDLSNSGYFSGVDIDASPSQAEDRVIPVTIGLTPRPPRSVSAGVGFSTDVGPRFRGNWREHYINSMGHKRGADTELSELRQSVSGWYELPLDPPMTDSIRLGTGYQREHVEDVESERLTFGQQWNHQLDNGWMQVLSMRWEGERFRIGDGERGTSSLLLPGVSYSKLQADSPLDPSRGFRYSWMSPGPTGRCFQMRIFCMSICLPRVCTPWLTTIVFLPGSTLAVLPPTIFPMCRPLCGSLPAVTRAYEGMVMRRFHRRTAMVWPLAVDISLWGVLSTSMSLPGTGVWPPLWMRVMP